MIVSSKRSSVVTLMCYAVEFLVGMLLDPLLWAHFLKNADKEAADLSRWNRTGL